MENDKKTPTAFYQMAGIKVKTPSFLSPVYSSYELLDLDEYIYRFNLDTICLYKDEAFMEGLDNLQSRKVIVPSYKNPVEYSPLETNPNLISSFAQIDNLDNDKATKQSFTNTSKFLTDDDIIAWISRNGLPIHNPLYLYPHHSSQASQRWSEPESLSMFDYLSYCETQLQFHSSPRRYVMLRDTFLGLQELSSNMFQATIAFLNNDLDNSLDLLSSISPSHLGDQFFDAEGFLIYRNPCFDTKNEILNVLSSMITFFLSDVRLTLSFEKNEIDNTPIAVQSWGINNLWSAMMLQLYHALAVKQQFKKCPSCGNYFSMMGQRVDRIYCPEGTGIYMDCKQHVKDSNRRKFK